MIITLVMMVTEIISGLLFNSVALFSDGCHMGTHFTAISITFLTFLMARIHRWDNKFAFGTWKIEILGAYTSAIILGIVGLFMVYVSVQRFIKPEAINYNSALLVAGLGLIVNISSMFILGFDNETHHHDVSKDHGSDLNIKSAFIHVAADAFTSVLIITALLGAKYFKWNFLDPVMGMLGAILIFIWSFSLLKDTFKILTDREMDTPIVQEIKDIIGKDSGTQLKDIHVWRVAQDKYACILSIFSEKVCTVDDYKQKLLKMNNLVHVTIELNIC